MKDVQEFELDDLAGSDDEEDGDEQRPLTSRRIEDDDIRNGKSRAEI
ncbi:hypothetical protein CCP1ISM_6070002 [Azospirillaceae bacterium]